MYGGDGGSSECKYELIRWTKVDFPAPAMPIVIMTTGFFFSVELEELDEGSMLATERYSRASGLKTR